MSRSALVIANPAAGFRSSDRRAEQAALRLAQLGMRTELHRTRGAGDGEKVAREAAGAFDLVIAAGGDGTVHEVANGLAGTQTPLGVVPLGSMNILARELGTPLDVQGACSWIARAEPAPVTMGLRDGRYFVLMTGIGYDAFALEAAHARARPSGRKVWFSDYALAAIIDAQRYSFPLFSVKSEGWTGAADFAIVANCPRYGANMRIAGRARLEEPLLDLVVLPRGRFVSRLRYFVAILAGTLEQIPGVVYRKVEEVAIAPDEGVRIPCQTDGEISEPLPASIRAVPGALFLLRTAGSE